jgi:hypothetical protein
VGMSEGNPFVSAFFPFFGHFWGVFVSKIVCVTVFYPILIRLNPNILTYCNLFFFFLVIWNSIIVVAAICKVL